MIFLRHDPALVASSISKSVYRHHFTDCDFLCAFHERTFCPY